MSDKAVTANGFFDVRRGLGWAGLVVVVHGART